MEYQQVKMILEQLKDMIYHLGEYVDIDEKNKKIYLLECDDKSEKQSFQFTLSFLFVRLVIVAIDELTQKQQNFIFDRYITKNKPPNKENEQELNDVLKRLTEVINAICEV